MNTAPPVRNIIAKGLGALWILDGLLQFQPQMFGQNFVNNILVPNLSDQPAFLHAIVAWGIALWNTNTLATNTAAALLQCAIGVLLLFPISSKTFRTGLWISILWGIIVWLCGEGAGLLLTGNATFYSGAPGAVLTYVLLAVLLLAPKKVSVEWYPKIAAWIFIFGAALQFQSVFWTMDGLQTSFMAAMMERVHMLNTIPDYILTVFSLHPVAGNALLAIVPLVVGLLILLKPSRATGAIACVLLFFVWWVGQDFGMLSTLMNGTSTDPNTAPLLALMLVPLFVRLDHSHDTTKV